MDIHLFAGLLLSAAIGLSLGLIGGGGSIITMPVLVYVIGVDAHQAVGMSLAVVGVTSLISTGMHYHRGTIDLKAGALFGASGILGAYFGSRLTYLIPPAALLLSFAALMLIIAVMMLLRKQRDVDAAEPHERSAAKAIFAGLVVGGLTGFLGVGGGFLVVPALLLFGGLTMKDAVGTSLLVITINCVAGLIGHLQYGGFDLRIAGMVTALAAAGAVVGTALSHRTSSVDLRNWFAVFVITVALFLVAKNHTILL